MSISSILFGIAAFLFFGAAVIQPDHTVAIINLAAGALNLFAAGYLMK